MALALQRVGSATRELIDARRTRDLARATTEAAWKLRRGLCFPAGRQRRNISRHPALQRFDPLSLFETGQVASDDSARGGQAGKLLADYGKRHARLFGDLRIEPLTIFLQALQDFSHAAHSWKNG